MTNPARMYRVTGNNGYDHSGNYLKTDEFNALYVVRYWTKLPKRSSRYWLRTQISKYWLRNIFHSLLCKPRLKPRCYGRHYDPPYLLVEFTGGAQRTFRFASNTGALDAFESLDKFMKSPY